MGGILIKSTVVKEYAVVKESVYNKADIYELDYLLGKVIEVCRKNYFHSFMYRCVYDNKFTKIANIEEVIFKISLGYMEYKSEYYGLNRKIRNAQGNGFLFNQISKLTLKIYSNISNINISYYLNLRIPIMHRKGFKILSQNPDYVINH